MRMEVPRTLQSDLSVAEQAGAYADMLVVDGNPFEDISLIVDPDRTMKIIMKDGRIHKNTRAA
ncbi:MAG: hypothetical protein M9955_22645 [Rhizobiaceae bacterium]|nr:hypothetical protein [Rhizobiaceae bacterium]